MYTMKTHTIHVRIASDLYALLKDISNKQGRTISELIREAIVLIISKYGGKP